MVGGAAFEVWKCRNESHALVVTRYNTSVFRPPSEMMIRINDATAMGLSGDREGARRSFDQMWTEIGADGDPLERVALAHSMADVQDEALNELSWDLRAFEAAGEVTDEPMRVKGIVGSARSLYPSLHLNLADVYERLGKRRDAYEHLRLGRTRSMNCRTMVTWR